MKLNSDERKTVDFCRIVKNEGAADFIQWDGFRRLTMSYKTSSKSRELKTEN